MKKLNTAICKIALPALAMCTLMAPSANIMAQEANFIGEMKYFAGNFAPRGWAKCDGQLLPIAQYSALFSIIGTIYGGDGRTTFALPDMRGRALIHNGRGPGLSDWRQGQRLGSEQEVMTSSSLPQHSHPVNASNAPAESSNPSSGVIASERLFKSAAPNENMDATSIASTGGSIPMSNVQPSIAIQCIIALQGIFPSRP